MTKNQKYILKLILEVCIYFISISRPFNNFKYKNINLNTFYKNYVKLNPIQNF